MLRGYELIGLCDPLRSDFILNKHACMLNSVLTARALREKKRVHPEMLRGYELIDKWFVRP